MRARRAMTTSSSEPGRFAYADPPYPGLSRKYYGREESFAGEVDHRELIARLEAGGYTGWALSTSWAALQDVLALCPRGVRVMPWVKPLAPDPKALGPTCRSEALIVRGGRAIRGAYVLDYLIAAPARLSGEPKLTGRKPLKFIAWLFDVLGMQLDDDLDDLYPGTGIVARSWAELSRVLPRQEGVVPISETEGDLRSSQESPLTAAKQP